MRNRQNIKVTQFRTQMKKGQSLWWRDKDSQRHREELLSMRELTLCTVQTEIIFSESKRKETKEKKGSVRVRE